MANELSISLNLNYAGGAVAEAVALQVFQDIATLRATKANPQIIGTTEEQFDLVDVSAPAYFFVRNQDADNFVEVGVATGVYPIELKPGQFAIFPPKTDALYLKADTAACPVQILALNS